MNYRLSLPVVLLLTLPAGLPAQTEEVSIPGFARAIDEFHAGKNTVTFGYRVLASGAQVRFGNLGTVPSTRTIEPASAGGVDRQYDNGFVRQDSPRAEEMDADGNTTSTPGKRYQTFLTNEDGSTTLSGDFLSYTPGLSRSWGYNNDSQLKGGGVAFSNYSATTEGAALSHSGGPAGGVELQLMRTLGKLSKRVEWSLAAGIALNDIHNKANGTVRSTLHTHTDVFSLHGLTAPGAPYKAPSYTDLNDADGNVIATSGLETTTPINATPDPALSADTATPGDATVAGNWKIKGAYYMMRLGPSVRARLTDRLGVSASLGLAGAYAGTNYGVVEELTVDGATAAITTNEESEARKFLPGFYADVNAEWLVNERAGFFAGASVQNFGDYRQSVGGRAARIDLGNSVGVRGGISIKF